jgi:hypothetical protein
MDTARGWWWGALVAATMSVAACGTVKGLTGGKGATMPLSVSSQLPAAEGQVRVNQEGNQQRLVIETKHLADPSRVMSGASVYVVWLEPQNAPGQRQNMGVLKVDDDKRGRLETTTPFRDFRVFVTAERVPNVTEPSQQLMTATVSPAGITY